MDRDALRDLVIDILRKAPQTHFRAVENEIRRLSQDYEKRDVLLLNEILWEMLLQGILAPGKNSLNPELPFIHVTHYGSQCLEGDVIASHDPQRYIERLIEKAGIDRSAPLFQDAAAAQQTFLDGRFPAAIALLARAAEHVLHDLADALIRRGRQDGHGIKRLESALADPSRLGPAARRSLAGYRLPAPLSEEVEDRIGGLASLITSTRTKARRPKLPVVDREGAHARFLLFLDQCRFAYDAIRWLEGKPEEA